MPLYVNGSPAASGKVRMVDVGEKIAAAIMENGGRIGDVSRYSESEMVFVRNAMREIAMKEVDRIMVMDWLSDIDIWKVVDEFDGTFEGVVE